MKNIFIIMLFSLVLMSGCTSKLAYNNLDWLLYWYMDDYIDLNRDQKRVFDPHLDVWLTWHRSNELNKYKLHLQQIQNQLQYGAISADQWEAHFADARQHWYSLRDKITVDLADMAKHLSEAQINALFVQLEEENAERLEEHAELSVADRAAKNVEDIQDRVHDWVGRLSTVQKNTIATRASELESNFDDWIMYRRNIQSQARLLLLQRHENINFSAEFLALLSHHELYQSQAFIDRAARNKRVFAELLAQISDGLSNKQMKTLNKKIEDLIEDIDDLVAD